MDTEGGGAGFRASPWEASVVQETLERCVSLQDTGPAGVGGTQRIPKVALTRLPGNLFIQPLPNNPMNCSDEQNKIHAVKETTV